MIKASFFLDDSLRIYSFLVEGHEEISRGGEALVCASASSSIRSFIRAFQKEGLQCRIDSSQKGLVSFTFLEKELSLKYEGMCRLLIQILQDLEKESPQVIEVCLSFV